MVGLAVATSLLLLLVLALYLHLLRKTTLDERAERTPVVHIISGPATPVSPQPQQFHQTGQRARVFTGRVWPAKLKMSGP